MLLIQKRNDIYSQNVYQYYNNIVQLIRHKLYVNQKLLFYCLFHDKFNPRFLKFYLSKYLFAGNINNFVLMRISYS